MNWIAVTEHMPVPNQEILACRVGKTCHRPFFAIHTFFAIHKNRKTNPWEYLDGETCYVRVTHWMAIPDLPPGEF